MTPIRTRILHPLPLLGALCLAGTTAGAAELPRVMFVSGTDAKPIIIDAQGRQIPAAKGVVIEPGFTVRVPEGATLQIMTPEKGVVAVRPNSLMKVESLGTGPLPYKLKLTQGGIRVANSDKEPRRFEVATPNANMKFDKGDHEAYFLTEGKLKDGRWGTFVRGFKEESTLTSRDSELRITRRDIGYVPGSGKEKAELIARIDASGKELRNPVSYVPGARAIGTTNMVENFAGMSDPASGSAGGKPGSGPSAFQSQRELAPGAMSFKSPGDIALKRPTVAPTLPTLAPATPRTAMTDLAPVAGIAALKPPAPDLIRATAVKVLDTPVGPVGLMQNADKISVMTTNPDKAFSVQISEIQGRTQQANDVQIKEISKEQLNRVPLTKLPDINSPRIKQP